MHFDGTHTLLLYNTIYIVYFFVYLLVLLRYIQGPRTAIVDNKELTEKQQVGFTSQNHRG
jgi:hypothetical protein